MSIPNTQVDNQMRLKKQTWTACTVIAMMGIATASGGQKQLNVEQKTEKKVIKSSTEYRFSRDVTPGRLVKRQDGQDGYSEKIYDVVSKDGKVIAKRLVDRKYVEPKNTVFAMSPSGYPTNRGSWTRSKIITMEATAYDPGAGLSKANYGQTKMGIRARFGVVAVDPRVIKLGTMVYVEGYGFAIAADTGGAIKGNRIDLCMATNAECNRFGRRQVKVHVLQGR